MIHGDFNGDNVLLDSTHAVPVALVDFEDCAMGEPADDIGCFLAHCSDLAAARSRCCGSAPPLSSTVP